MRETDAHLPPSPDSRSPSSCSLSHAQRALWYMHRRAPESSAYTGAFAARMHASVNVSALRQAFQLLVDRHATLRTTLTLDQQFPLAPNIPIRPMSESCLGAHFVPYVSGLMPPA
jgi:hypothetical protein